MESAESFSGTRLLFYCFLRFSLSIKLSVSEIDAKVGGNHKNIDDVEGKCNPVYLVLGIFSAGFTVIKMYRELAV